MIVCLYKAPSIRKYFRQIILIEQLRVGEAFIDCFEFGIHRVSPTIALVTHQSL